MDAEPLRARDLAQVLDPILQRRGDAVLLLRQDNEHMSSVSQAALFAQPVTPSEQFDILMGIYASAIATLAAQAVAPAAVLDELRRMADAVLASPDVEHRRRVRE